MEDGVGTRCPWWLCAGGGGGTLTAALSVRGISLWGVGRLDNELGRHGVWVLAA